MQLLDNTHCMQVVQRQAHSHRQCMLRGHKAQDQGCALVVMSAEVEVRYHGRRSVEQQEKVSKCELRCRRCSGRPWEVPGKLRPCWKPGQMVARQRRPHRSVVSTRPPGGDCARARATVLCRFAPSNSCLQLTSSPSALMTRCKRVRVLHFFRNSDHR